MALTNEEAEPQLLSLSCHYPCAFYLQAVIRFQYQYAQTSQRLTTIIRTKGVHNFAACHHTCFSYCHQITINKSKFNLKITTFFLDRPRPVQFRREQTDDACAMKIIWVHQLKPICITYWSTLQVAGRGFVERTQSKQMEEIRCLLVYDLLLPVIASGKLE